MERRWPSAQIRCVGKATDLSSHPPHAMILLKTMKDTKTRSDTEGKIDKQSKSITSPVQSTPLDEVPAEIGGPKGLEPTRYGDWEKDGRVSDF